MRILERYMNTGRQTGAFDESTSVTLDIPRDRLIQMAQVHISATLANAAGAAVTLTKRQIMSMFDTISLNVNGTSGPVGGVQGAMYYDLLKYSLGRDPVVFDVGTPVDRDGTVSIAAGASEVVRFGVPFYFMDNPNNPLDVSCLLDSRAASTLDFSFTTRAGWLPASANVTITGATSSSNIYLREVIASPDELAALNKDNGYPGFYNVFYKQQRGQTVTTSAGFAQSVDMLVGYNHRQIGFGMYDASAADWAQDIVDTIQVKQLATNGGSDIDHLVNLDLEVSQIEDSLVSGASIDAGFTTWDCAHKVLNGRIGGLDTVGMKNGDLKCFYNTGATVASGTDSMDLIYKSLLPA